MSSTGSGYDQSVSTYSPEGKLYQVEYAEKAVENSGTAIGVRCKDGVILGVEKLLTSKMLVEGSGRRVHAIDEHIGMAFAGLVPDARQLVIRARDEARGYRQNFGEAIPTKTLNDRLGAFVHLYTVYWYLRPFGATVLLAGYDAQTARHELYCVEPTGVATRYFGAAAGKGARAAKTEIEKYKFEDKTAAEALGYVAKILHSVHDDAKDKPFELELGWVTEATGWKYTAVSKEARDAADAWAKAQIAADEQGSDDDE
jgi:20S proteasome subunit alpha 7